MLDKCQWYSLDATNVEDEKTINTVWMSQMWKGKKKFFLQLTVFEHALPEKKLKQCFENIQVLPRFELGSQDSES